MPENNIYILKVTMDDWMGRAKGNPSRTLAIRGNASLYKLAEAIVACFDFDFDHAFGFYSNLEKMYQSKEIYELFTDLPEVEHTPGAGSVQKTRVKQVFDKIGKTMLFFFDYGDDWHFPTELLGIAPQEKGKKYPLILDSQGEAPEQYGPCDEE